MALMPRSCLRTSAGLPVQTRMDLPTCDRYHAGPHNECDSKSQCSRRLRAPAEPSKSHYDFLDCTRGSFQTNRAPPGLGQDISQLRLLTFASPPVHTTQRNILPRSFFIEPDGVFKFLGAA